MEAILLKLLNVRFVVHGYQFQKMAFQKENLYSLLLILRIMMLMPFVMI